MSGGQGPDESMPEAECMYLYLTNKEIAIVTNEYHEYRAGMVADALEMEHSAVPARTPLWLFPTYYIRELYGIIYEWVL